MKARRASRIDRVLWMRSAIVWSVVYWAARPTISAKNSAGTVSGCRKKATMFAQAPVAEGSPSGTQSAVLPAAAAASQIPGTPPVAVDATIHTVAPRPPNITVNWITSFQITASMPPSIV